MNTLKNATGRIWEHIPAGNETQSRKDYLHTGRLLLSTQALLALKDEDLANLLNCIENVRQQASKEGLQQVEEFRSKDGLTIHLHDSLSKTEMQHYQPNANALYMAHTGIIRLPDEAGTVSGRIQWMKSILLSNSPKAPVSVLGWERQPQDNKDSGGYYFNGMVYTTQRIASELPPEDYMMILRDTLLFALASPDGIDYIQSYENKFKKQKVFVIDNFSRKLLESTEAKEEIKVKNHYLTILFADEY